MINENLRVLEGDRLNYNPLDEFLDRGNVKEKSAWKEQRNLFEGLYIDERTKKLMELMFSQGYTAGKYSERTSVIKLYQEDFDSFQGLILSENENAKKPKEVKFK